jgi:hypothetical protein
MKMILEQYHLETIVLPMIKLGERRYIVEKNYKQIFNEVLKGITHKWKSKICERIKDYLDEVYQTTDRKLKEIQVTQMFDYLVDQKDFVERHPKFSICVKNKLLEFARDYDFTLSWHYKNLFDEELIL